MMFDTNLIFWDTNHYIRGRKDDRFEPFECTYCISDGACFKLKENTPMVDIANDYDVMIKAASNFGVIAWVDGKGKRFSQR